MAPTRRGSLENSFSPKQNLVKGKVKEEAVREEKETKENVEKQVKPVSNEKAPVKEKAKKNKTTNDMIFAVAEKKHGVQRSIYFESDNFDYINDLANKYNAQLSKIVNIIIAQHRENAGGE